MAEFNAKNSTKLPPDRVFGAQLDYSFRKKETAWSGPSRSISYAKYIILYTIHALQKIVMYVSVFFGPKRQMLALRIQST